MAKFGFAHGMWNAKVWWEERSEGNFAEIIEINPRPATYSWQMLQLGAGYAVYPVAADMALGGSGMPPSPPRRHGVVEHVAITTTAEGVAADLVDFPMLQHFASQDDATVIYHCHPQDMTRQLTPYPVIVAELIRWSS